MGSIQKLPNGKWRGWCKPVNGKRQSRVFIRKGDARDWVDRTEASILSGHTLHDAFDRYERTVSPTKKGHDWEVARLAKFREYFPDKLIADVSKADIAGWRDWRSESVGPATVSREFTLLSSVFTLAQTEWEWIRDHPCRGVRRPRQPPHRTRVFTDEEIERICLALDAGEKSRIIRDVFLFALETGMRAGEIINLVAGDVLNNTVRVRESKNGHPRTVPLNSKALAIVDAYRSPEGSPVLPIKTKIFDIESGTRDALFRRALRRCGITDATFHDARHTAITRMVNAGRLNVAQIAAIVGHKNLNMLSVYFNPSAADLAKLLD